MPCPFDEGLPAVQINRGAPTKLANQRIPGLAGKRKGGDPTGIFFGEAVKVDPLGQYTDHRTGGDRAIQNKITAATQGK